MKWCIYYDDGCTFSSDDGTAEEAPVDGVQVVVEWFDNGNVKIHEGSDYYWFTGDGWAYGNVSSLDRWLRVMCPQVKFGRFTRNAVYEAAIRDAQTPCR